MAVNVDKDLAGVLLETLCKTATKVNDTLANDIDKILNGTHKTYKYILITGLLAKAVNGCVDIFSLQAQDDSDGAYDARSLCHYVLVPFEREHIMGSLGGSNEPFLNKPARYTRLSYTNAVRAGADMMIRDLLISVFGRITTKEIAQTYLSSAIATLKEIFDNLELKYNIENLALDNTASVQNIMDYVSELIKKSCEGQVCPLVVSVIEQNYLGSDYVVIPHKVNECGASSKEIGDIDIYYGDNAVFSIEVKDKDFSKEDVEHAIRKFAEAKIPKSLFIYGAKAHFEENDVNQTAARYGRLGYFCSVISIVDYVKMRLASMGEVLSMEEFVQQLLDFGKKINVHDDTLNWIKESAKIFTSNQK